MTVIGASKIPLLVSELPGNARTLLVSMILDRFGKKTNSMQFPEMMASVNTYTDEISWPNLNREETRRALECLRDYSLVRGGANIYARKLDFDEVPPTLLT
jgi:hypothetical protein